MSRGLGSLVGDGTFIFSVPAAAFWVAHRYGTLALTVTYDNRGWRAPKQSTLGAHLSVVLKGALAAVHSRRAAAVAAHIPKARGA